MYSIYQVLLLKKDFTLWGSALGKSARKLCSLCQGLELEQTSPYTNQLGCCTRTLL